MKQVFYKIIYSPIINRILRNVNKFLSPILPNKIKIPPSGTLQFRISDKKKLKIKTNQTSYLTYSLFWFGFKNYEYTDIFIHLIKKVNVFYDIGANIGYYSLIAALENDSLKVIAFEPASSPLFFLKENTRLNNIKNIRMEGIALSEKTGKIQFYEVKNKKYTYLSHSLAGEGNTGTKTTNRNYQHKSVTTTTLNEYIIKNSETNIDIIKLDTEGTEHLILEHAHEVLEKMKPIIICETLFNVIEGKLESLFKKYNYEFYNHTNDGLKKVSTIQREFDNGVRNCFFVHPSKYYLIKEYVN